MKMELIVYSAESPNCSVQRIILGRNMNGDLELSENFGVNLHLVSYKLLNKSEALELIKILNERKIKITIEKVDD